MFCLVYFIPLAFLHHEETSVGMSVNAAPRKQSLLLNASHKGVVGLEPAVVLLKQNPIVLLRFAINIFLTK